MFLLRISASAGKLIGIFLMFSRVNCSYEIQIITETAPPQIHASWLTCVFKRDCVDFKQVHTVAFFAQFKTDAPIRHFGNCFPSREVHPPERDQLTAIVLVFPHSHRDLYIRIGLGKNCSKSHDALEVAHFAIVVKVIPGCSSHDFMRKDEMLIPFERLHRAYEGRGLAQALTKFDSPADRIAYTVGFVERVTNLTGVGAYLTAILELDCLTLNEDRHTNNLAVLRNEETKEFRLCPIFDNGLSLLSDLNDYPLTDDLYTCIERVQAKPFDSDHVEQVTAAEQLYGRQLTFRISHGELRSELNLLSEAYSPDILQRAERVLLEQKRKHSWLF